MLGVTAASRCRCTALKLCWQLYLDPHPHYVYPGFWIVALYEGKPLEREAADIVAWAWRALYAAVVKAHADEKHIDYRMTILQFHQYT